MPRTAHVCGTLRGRVSAYAETRRFSRGTPSAHLRCVDALLTPREREIVERVAMGLSNKSVAYELGVCESTVATHLARAMRKLGVTRREALVPRPQASATLSHLTAAEREVVALVLSGKTDRAIAKARGTSPRTVANQLRSVFRKLDVSSRCELLHRLAVDVAS